MAATLICNSSIPSFLSSSGWMGCRPFAHNRRTRSSVSSPERVVRSMQVTARRSQAACHSFFTVRRATWDWTRRSTALVLTRTSRTQSRLRGMPVFGNRGRPERIAIASLTLPGAMGAALRNSLCSTAIQCFLDANCASYQVHRFSNATNSCEFDAAPARFDCTADTAKDAFRFRLDTGRLRGYATARFLQANNL